jgi:hypothetical protein
VRERRGPFFHVAAPRKAKPIENKMRFSTLTGTTVSLAVDDSETVADVVSRLRTTIAFEGDVSMILDGDRVPHDENIARLKASERVVTVTDVIGEFPPVFMQVITAVNSFVCKPIMYISANGQPTLSDAFVLSLKPLLIQQKQRKCIAITVNVADETVFFMMRNAEDLLLLAYQNAHFTYNLARIITNFDSENAVPVVVTSLNPAHTSIFLQNFP